MCERAGCRTTGACLAGVAAGIAVADVALIKSGHHTISTLIRTNKWLRAFAVYLAVHLLFDFRCDPLHWTAKRLIPQTGTSLR